MTSADIPRHIAIIMDGNGRWGKKRLLPRTAGHRAGAQNLRKLAVEVERLGVKYLTVFAFSTENWTRPKDEVEYLMHMVHEYIQQYIDDTRKNNMRLSVIGDISRLEPSLQDKISDLTAMTAGKKGLHLVIALNYGGRDDIVRAARCLAEQARAGTLLPSAIDDDTFSRMLDTAPYPDPDLLIRCGDEMRISNFILWQAAYTEIYFSPKLWPD